MTADELERRAIAAAIALPAHVVQQKGHGHAGSAMALGTLAHVLYQRVLRHAPRDPDWPGRDRVVLSAGHASMLLYTQLFLTGYGLELSDLAAARTLGAKTPGHPERHCTAGVEMTTGPLGQGLASAVGVATALRHEHATFATPHDPTVWVIAGDGCLEEGVSGEASSLAGTLGLDALVVIYDDNGVTIDAMTDESFTEDVRARYAAYGWRVLDIADASDDAEIERVLREAAVRTGAPTLVAVRSTIAAPAGPEIAGTPAAHFGGIGEAQLALVHERLGFDRDASLADLVPDAVLAHTRLVRDVGDERVAAWQRDVEAWRAADPENADAWHARRSANGVLDASVLDSLPEPSGEEATRVASGRALTALAARGAMLGGSADLAASTNVAVPGARIDAEHPGGAFVRFGVREHAMAAWANGVALVGLHRAYTSTYLVFSDYTRPALRLAALMELPTIFVCTHDSLGVGEDGPTHQPVEQLWSLRMVPGLAVVRPADSLEAVSVWRRLAGDTSAPVVLALSRHAVPQLERDAVLSGVALDTAVAHGAYAVNAVDEPDGVIIATGSEVALALAAARSLAGEARIRVVSAPCLEWFAAQSDEYRAATLPGVPTLAVEAGVEGAWRVYADDVVCVTGFGEPGPGAVVLERAGFTAEHIAARMRALLA